MPNLNVGNHRRHFDQMKSHTNNDATTLNGGDHTTKSVLPIGDDEFADYEKIERVHLVDEPVTMPMVVGATDYTSTTSTTTTTKRRNLRVIIVTESFHPYTSGIARRFKEIIERLAKRGYRIHVITGCKVRRSSCRRIYNEYIYIDHIIIDLLNNKGLRRLDKRSQTEGPSDV